MIQQSPGALSAEPVFTPRRSGYTDALAAHHEALADKVTDVAAAGRHDVATGRAGR